MTFSICVLILASLVSGGYSSFLTSENRPHIIHILVDDLGWAELGYHRHDDEGDVNTSFIDELVRTESYISLDRVDTHTHTYTHTTHTHTYTHTTHTYTHTTHTHTYTHTTQIRAGSILHAQDM